MQPARRRNGLRVPFGHKIPAEDDGVRTRKAGPVPGISEILLKQPKDWTEGSETARRYFVSLT